jgi:hypothetical protein
VIEQNKNMTSAAKLRANRRNARKSTGPRTLAGKAIVGRNARRHGFSLPVLDDPTLSREAEDLARTIERAVTGAEADASGHALACRIAEAMIDLKRVRDAKLPVIVALHADVKNSARPLREFARLDRYERRALSRRKFAVREFAAAAATARAEAGGANPAGPAKPFGRTKPTEKGQ